MSSSTFLVLETEEGTGCGLEASWKQVFRFDSFFGMEETKFGLVIATCELSCHASLWLGFPAGRIQQLFSWNRQRWLALLLLGTQRRSCLVEGHAWG